MVLYLFACVVRLRMSERVLIVDDDPVQRRLLDNMVRKFGYEPLVAEGGDAAIAALTGSDGANIDAVVLDLVMPDLDGLGVLAKMREAGINVPVIVQTAHGGIDNVVTAMRAGATDFVVKPVGAERLQVSLRNALAASVLEDELARIKRSRSGTLGFKDIITRSPRMQVALRTAEKAATSAIPVLIEGQSGVGKELIARAIHGSGERRSKPFVPTTSWSRCCSGTRRAPSPAPPIATPANSSRPPAARSFSTRWASSLRRRRSSSCARSRRVRSSRSARASR
jgi:DNA-binding NtrC family response regulator